MMYDSKPTCVSVDISQRKINQAIGVVFFLNIFILSGTWLHHSLLLENMPGAIKRAVAQLNLSTENVAATWYSSMLLLAVAIAAGGCYLADTQRMDHWKGRFLNRGWLFLIMIFLLLSFDEMGSFHEMIGETDLFKNMGKDPGAGWYAFYVLIALVGIFMLSFSLITFRKSPWAFFFATLGILLLASNPLQENYEINSWHNSADPSAWKRPMFFLLLEEGSEIFASFCFLVSFGIYASYSSAKNNPGPNSKGYKINLIFKRNYILYPLIFIIILIILMFIIKLNAWHFKGDDIGIPHNWFPSAMLFLTAAVSMLLYLINTKMIQRRYYLLLAAHCIFTSIYFGSNFSQFSHFAIIYTSILFTGSVCLELLFFYKSGKVFTTLAFIAWSVLYFTIIITIGFLAALLCYMSASCLLLALFLHNYQLAIKSENYHIAA